MTIAEFEEVVRILPDELAWDMLARDGWRLVDYWSDDRVETWAKDWDLIHRWREEEA